MISQVNQQKLISALLAAFILEADSIPCWLFKWVRLQKYTPKLYNPLIQSTLEADPIAVKPVIIQMLNWQDEHLKRNSASWKLEKSIEILQNGTVWFFFFNMNVSIY